MLSKFFTFSLSAFIALLFTTMSYGQVVIFVDNFDSYTAGMQLVVQNPIDWETYSGGSGTGEDPYVSDLYAFGGTNSVFIVPNNDLVKPLGDLTSGKYSIAFMVYIPTGKNGIFSTLSDFITGSVWESAMGVVFDPGGSGRLNAGGFGAATFTYAHDTWQSVEVIVDLDNDIGEFWFEGDSVHTWQWTLGAMGTGSALQLAASEFWVHSPGNHEMYIDDFVFTSLEPVSVENEGDVKVPLTFGLEQNYPNPFNPSTKITFGVPVKSHIVMKVFNALGSEVAILVNEEKPAGTYELTWNAEQLPSGIYFYRLQAGGFVETKKMVLMK
jgi:hypothetical protein